MAQTHSLDVLGRPRCWSLVRERFHPISPERVIVMTEKGGDGCNRLNGSFQKSLPDPFNFPAGKFALISRLMQVMTDHYRLPESSSKWATKLAKREALASTGIGCGFGLLHQFQDVGSNVELVNPPVDWWLALFPEGIKWDALDEKPVFGMIGHVFPGHFFKSYGLALRVWELTGRSARNVAQEFGTDAWMRIARLDRITAAQVVNQAIVGTLACPILKAGVAVESLLWVI